MTEIKTIIIQLSHFSTRLPRRAGKRPRFEFHIHAAAREKYQFDQSLFTTSGNVVFANFHAARVFAQKINAQRDLVSHPEQAVKAGHINAMGLIDEILHYMLRLYEETANPNVFKRALAYLN